MKLRPERLTELYQEVAQERLCLRTGSPSDAEIGREKLADLAVSYIPELIDEVRRLSMLSVLPTPAAVSLTEREEGATPLADAELAELAKLAETLDACLVEAEDTGLWDLQVAELEKGIGKATATLRNALPGLLARLAASPASVSSPQINRIHVHQQARDLHYTLIEQFGLHDDGPTNLLVRKLLVENLSAATPLGVVEPASAASPTRKGSSEEVEVAGYHSTELADISSIITWLHAQNKPMGELMRRFFSDARQGKVIKEYNDIDPLPQP